MNCNRPTLRPDDLISPCLLADGHPGFCNGECICRTDEFGPIFCDAHRPKPTLCDCGFSICCTHKPKEATL